MALRLNINGCPMTASYSDGISNTTNSVFNLVCGGAIPTSKVSLIDPLAVVKALLSSRTILEYGRRKLACMPIYSRVLVKRMLMALTVSTMTFGMITPSQALRLLGP